LPDAEVKPTIGIARSWGQCDAEVEPAFRQEIERRRRVLQAELTRLASNALVATFGAILLIVAVQVAAPSLAVAAAVIGIGLVPAPWLVALRKATRR
jgi:Flp pilus assembly protein TadB